MDNGLIRDNLETNHDFNPKDFKMFVYMHNKKAVK